MKQRYAIPTWVGFLAFGILASQLPQDISLMGSAAALVVACAFAQFVYLDLKD